MKKLLGILVAVMMPVMMCVFVTTPTFAESATSSATSGNTCGGVETNIINCDEDDGAGGPIFAILNIILNILTFGIGTGATIGFVISGYQYLTARDNEGQVVKAKMRMLNIVLGLALYAAIWTVLQWLLPGGLFGSGN